MDDRFGQATLLICPVCNQYWLHYSYELEAFTASGRWYRGAINEEQAARVAAGETRSILEGLSWYFYGGSYFEGRSGKAAGTIY